jgi:hypothetical protein
MPFDPTNPPACLTDGFSSLMPRLFSWSSTNVASDFSLLPATTAAAEANRGYFKGCGDGSKNGGQIGMRPRDVLMHVSQATLGTTDFPAGFPGIVTFHSVIASTADGSTVSPSVGYNVSVSQPSLGG